ncbi:GDP-mannose 4,6-dehydratase [Candidatus Woesearchaeota archaeon]|nr:GDP-mannose 4,6-dehydratase [Candidatus Woesearchaeota archaeon]
MISLITGIGGFVGPHLARHLLENNHEVIGLERNPRRIAGCRVFACDILEREKLDGIIGRVRPDFVFHLAAITSVSESIKYPGLTMKVNVDGARNVLESVLKVNANASVLVVSSAHVYGIPKKLPISEDHLLNPISPYARSRVEEEAMAMDFFRLKGLKVVVSRSFNHTGPGQPAGFVCSDFARQIAEIEAGAKPVIHVGPLSASRDFTDVRDVVRAYLYAVKDCRPGNIYNICSGRGYSAKEILDMLLELTDKRIEVVENKKLKEGDIPFLVGNNSKFVSDTGWHPEIPFHKTLKDLLDYWRKRV